MNEKFPLQLSPEQMRDLGTRALEMVIHHFENNRNESVARTLTREQTEAMLRTPLPEQGTDVNALLELLGRDVFPNAFKSDHPRFYSFVPSPTNFVSVIGDLLTSGHNLFLGHWMAAAAATQIEITVIDWLKEICGLPATGGGILVSGGSMANLTALAAARESMLGGPDSRAIIYCTDQTHSSVFKALRILGFRLDQRRIIETDRNFSMLPSALETAIAQDRAAGCVPFCVVANGGTTNTGAVDPMITLSEICQREKMWLHVDGAYGAAAVIVERGRTALRGMELADSVTVDPHKWLFQPYELGCVLMRDGDALQRAFRIEDDDHADYLADVKRHVLMDVNYYEQGVQLTRSFKALKLWLSLRTFGLSEFRRAVDVGFDMADAAERALLRNDHWEIVTASQMAVITFRWKDARFSEAQIDAIVTETVERMRADGYALVMSTKLKHRPVLRLCPINPTTTVDEISETVDRLTRFAMLAAEGIVGLRDR